MCFFFLFIWKVLVGIRSEIDIDILLFLLNKFGRSFGKVSEGIVVWGSLGGDERLE